MVRKASLFASRLGPQPRLMLWRKRRKAQEKMGTPGQFKTARAIPEIFHASRRKERSTGPTLAERGAVGDLVPRPLDELAQRAVLVLRLVADLKGAVFEDDRFFRNVVAGSSGPCNALPRH